MLQSISGGAQSSGSHSSKRGPRPRLFAKNACQADECPVDLQGLPYYNRRNHICMTHKVAESYLRLGERVRFCFRCGVAHPLLVFDGVKRSCREKLEKFNARRRKAPSVTPAASAPAGTPSPAVSFAPAPAAPALAALAAPELTPELEMVGAFSPPPQLLLPPPDDADAALPELSLGLSGGMSGGGSEGSVDSVHASSVSDDEGICCATATSSERVCCDDGMEPATPIAGAAAGGSAFCAAAEFACGVTAGDQADAAAAVGGGAVACDRDDSDAGAGGNRVSGSMSGAMATLEAELAALRATDAALYAMMVQQQIMRARLLMATGEALMRRSLSGRSLALSRRASSDELSTAMVS